MADKVEKKPKKRDSGIKLVFGVLAVSAVLVIGLVVAWVITKEILFFACGCVLFLLSLLAVAPYIVRRMMVYGKMSRASIRLGRGEYTVAEVAYTKHRLGGILSRHLIVQLKKGNKTYDKRFILDETFFNARGRREWLDFCEKIGVQHESIERIILTQKDAQLLELYLKGLCGKTYTVR